MFLNANSVIDDFCVSYSYSFIYFIFFFSCLIKNYLIYYEIQYIWLNNRKPIGFADDRKKGIQKYNKNCITLHCEIPRFNKEEFSYILLLIICLLKWEP